MTDRSSAAPAALAFDNRLESAPKDPHRRAGWRTMAGLFLTTLATLMFEVLLTRIFSVTMWYHFAFMAVSIAMFGMTAGALVVFVRPRWFEPERLLNSC